jgi:hypothetical protein
LVPASIRKERRGSWIDLASSVTGGVHDTDGGFIESFM